MTTQHTLLAHGDSLTEGYGLPLEHALPAVLERKLRSGGFAVSVINMGLSGDTTSGGLRRLRSWLRANPSTTLAGCMVELGANDQMSGIPLAEAEANLNAMLHTLAQAHVPALLIGWKSIIWDDLVPYGEPCFHVTPSDHDPWLQLYERLAAHHHVPLLPDMLAGVVNVATHTLPDGLHPSLAGVEVIAGRVYPHAVALLTQGTR